VPTDKPRVMVTLDHDIHEMLDEVATMTGLTVAGIIARFMGAHLEELAEYIEWMRKQKKGSLGQVRGRNLLVSYGPENLLQGIRDLDPGHKFISQAFQEQIGD
jgi:hypothetical protein